MNEIAHSAIPSRSVLSGPPATSRSAVLLRSAYLDLLEAEAISIIRETVAELSNPVLLYSIGKDSQVLLHVARKAFHPAPLPFPLLHVDTSWKFRAMYEFRDQMAAQLGLRLLVHRNEEALAANVNPFDVSTQVYTHTVKTQPLLQALAHHRFDAALGGARRDEERSRAKERVFSFRDRNGQWDPRRQRPELWDLYNGRVRPGESIRVFPLSNWTEFDIWLYILRENIPVVPLYFAAQRPVVSRSGTWLMVDDERMRLRPGERPELRQVRFRTLGCYPLSGAVESSATSVADIMMEMLDSRSSERAGRLIDFDEDGSMEIKKREGYF